MKKFVTIEGMTCNHCVGHVQDSLKAIQGIDTYKVDLKTGLAEITGDTLDEQKIKDAIVDLGYSVKNILTKA